MKSRWKTLVGIPLNDTSSSFTSDGGFNDTQCGWYMTFNCTGGDYYCPPPPFSLRGCYPIFMENLGFKKLPSDGAFFFIMASCNSMDKWSVVQYGELFFHL